MASSREEFTVQVLRNGSGVPAGVGFVVDETHIVTCAHVVNTALGRRKLEQDPPDPGARVQVALPLLDGDDDAPTLSCMVQKWVPPPTLGVSGGDVAGLAVDGDELRELARASWLADYREFRDAEAKMFGYPGDPPRQENGGWATVRVRGRVGRRMIQLDVASESAFFVQPGYSGSPVVVTDADGHDLVVGMLSAADADGAKDALAIPAAALALAWPEVAARLPIRKCPYLGLEAFTADDADVFVGRKDDIDRLREMVRGRALTMVTGPSGVGKSSLVNAGLIPRLEAEGWAAGAFRPGREPVQAIARALASVEAGGKPAVEEMEKWTARILFMGLGDAGARLALALGQPVVLHADQLEEVLDPQVCAPDVKAEFLELLLSAHSAADKGLHLVGAVRADFLAQLLEHPDAGTRLAGGWFGLSPMSTDRLKTVITEPARARGVGYEDGLAAVIARDSGNGAALPLLEFTLTQLWEHKRGPEISHAAYQGIGGVAGALSRYAKNVYQDDLLKQFPMERIRRVLLALVRSRGGAADATRRVVSRDRLGADWDIAQALASHRLVTISRDDSKGTETAEIVHEALIREWPTLATWVNNDSDFQRWLSTAEERAAVGELLPDTRLADADGWLADRAEDIPPEVRQLIQDSKSEWQGRITELEVARNRAEARRLAAAAELALATPETSLQIPIILAIEALRTAPVAEADIAIRHAIRTAARPISHADHDGMVRAVAFSPDGTRIATASSDRSARVIDSATGAEITRINHDGMVYAVAYSPDGTRIATGSDAVFRHGSARVIDAATGAEISHADHRDTVRAVVFSPDGTRIATGSERLRGGGSARVIDAATGTEISHLDHDGIVYAVAYSPDGTRIATASSDCSARVIDSATGAEITRINHDGPVHAVAFSPDGTRIATASSGPRGRAGSARVIDAATGAELTCIKHHGEVRAVVFSPDGTRIATASENPGGSGSARVIDAATGAEITHLEHDRPVISVVFSPDGTRIATALGHWFSGDGYGSARVIDAATGTEITRLDDDGPVHTVVFSPDGTQIATGSSSQGIVAGSARVIDAATGAEISCLQHDGPVCAVVFSPDGTRIATASENPGGAGSARVIDAATRTEITHLEHDDLVHAVVFSLDGTRIATASGDVLGEGSARVIDAATGDEICCFHHDHDVNAVVFSPDGTRIATASGRPNSYGSARVIDAATGAELTRIIHDGPVHAVVFSPDGTRIATASDSPVVVGSARVIDAVTGAEITRVDHYFPVYSVVFSPDGTRIATGSHSRDSGGGGVGSARVINAASGAEITRVDHDGWVYSVVFSPDGTQIATGSNGRDSRGGGSARVINAATGAEISRHDHDGPVTAVVFSPDGTQIAATSQDRSARVIDAETGAEISCLEHGDQVTAVVFSPDGTQVATANEDRSARVWCIDHSLLMEQAMGRLTRNLTRQEWNRYFRDEPYRKTRKDLP